MVIKLEKIFFSELKTSLGSSWAAFSDKGLLSFNTLNTRNKFLTEIKRRTDAELVEKPSMFSELLNWLMDYLRGKPVKYEGALDLRGTRFQKDIWRAVYEIPYGMLSSYSGLARRIGKPRAYRAAGNAVASNPIGLIIPCHRVIRSDGGIGGFGGRLELKRKLLALEGILPDPSKESEKRTDLKSYFTESH